MAHQSDRLNLDATNGPMTPSARAALSAAVEECWGDPRRLHEPGRLAQRRLDEAREAFAAALGTGPADMSFFPTGAAALRVGLSGLMYAGRRRGTQVALSAVEHSALLLHRNWLAQRTSGPVLDPVPVDSFGRIELTAWRHQVGVEGVTAAALQVGNAEVGTRQPLHQAYAACQEHAVPLLVDATASLGRDELPEHWDVLVGDARSWGGPPLGILAVRSGTRWRVDAPWSPFEGGRSDIEPWLPQVLAALAAWPEEDERRHDATLAHELVNSIRHLASTLPDTDVHGDPQDRLAHVLSMSCLYLPGDELVRALDSRGIAVASGSLCTSSTLEPSHVLVAMGAITHGNLRITVPTLAQDPGRAASVAQLCAELPAVVGQVRQMMGVD